MSHIVKFDSLRITVINTLSSEFKSITNCLLQYSLILNISYKFFGILDFLQLDFSRILKSLLYITIEISLKFEFLFSFDHLKIFR